MSNFSTYYSNICCQTIEQLCQQILIGNDTKEWQIQLVGGGVLWEGRVEVYLFGEWGTASGHNYRYYSAHAVCRQLGYSVYGKCYPVKNM